MGSTGVKIGLPILILTLIPSLVLALGVHVTWNQNTENDIAGYLVYCGTSPGSYDRIVGADLSAGVDIRGLDPGRTYYFAVTARDRSGNQSGYSKEVVISIPVQYGAITGTGTGSAGNGTPGSLIGTVVDSAEGLLRKLLGLGPDDPLYQISHPDGPDSSRTQTAGVVPAGSMVPVDGRASADRSIKSEAPEKKYPVRDAVLKSYTPFDLATLYPEGMFLFYPLDAGCPDIDGDMITIEVPGRFLYMVFNELGDISHVLRLSVADELYQLQTYYPDSSLFIEDEIFGVAIRIPADAAVEPKPVAIGWGGDGLFQASGSVLAGALAVVFDILPYGLQLDEPALVTVPYGGAEPCVQRYDETSGTWVAVMDVAFSGGQVVFSTQILGRFRVEERSLSQADGVSAAYGENRDTCFVDVCRHSCASGGPVMPCLVFSLMSGVLMIAVARAYRD